MTEWVHQIQVRYGECDMQGVVFNANYLAYVDHALDLWFRDELGTNYQDRFDFMVKKVTLDWDSPARAHETLQVRPEITRWGRTSFDLTAWLSVGDRKVARADLVYVSITPGTHRPAEIPAEVRTALS